jgi:[ribosomal protein S18]-alanine N-acetyltransferase
MATVAARIRLERGTSSDLDAVMRVMNAAFERRFGEAWTRSQCAGILPMAGVVLTLARDHETAQIVGFSLIRTVADESELLLVAVLPAHHRQGIGQSLLDDFIDRSRAKGVGRVHLEVRDGNPAAALYRSAGFVSVGRRKNYYHGADGERFDAVTFARDL